jgi:putative FmdB family regulatory protein
MPIYEYRCNECQQIFEEWQHDFKEREVPCPVCNSAAKRLISSTSFVLKGSGWYVTDYCNKRQSNAHSASSNGDGDKKSESGSSPAPSAASDTSGSSGSSSTTD